MSRRSMLIGAGMLFIGGATYFSVMKSSQNHYKNYMTNISKKSNLVLPKDTVFFTPKKLPQVIMNKTDTIDISSAIRGFQKILKK